MLSYLGKCLVGGMSGRGDDKLGKCHVGEISDRELSSHENVRHGNLRQRNCQSERCPRGDCYSEICSGTQFHMFSRILQQIH